MLIATGMAFLFLFLLVVAVFATVRRRTGEP
jgi:Na+-transporting methylmalonyl-CoA/oxaloacetate decarboxylase gamma subunit